MKPLRHLYSIYTYKYINKILDIEEIQDEKKEVCVTYARVSS